jgi:hypothetical protein
MTAALALPAPTQPVEPVAKVKCGCCGGAGRHEVEGKWGSASLGCDPCDHSGYVKGECGICGLAIVFFDTAEWRSDDDRWAHEECGVIRDTTRAIERLRKQGLNGLADEKAAWLKRVTGYEVAR